MGNRAVITTMNHWQDKSHGIGIYVHWNGGRDSVKPFLDYCKMKGYRSPETDCYGWASLGAVITNFFGAEGLSIGIDCLDCFDCNNYDNGVYIIEDWKIIDRQYFDGIEQDYIPYDEMIKEINNSMPEAAQIDEITLNELIDEYK